MRRMGVAAVLVGLAAGCGPRDQNRDGKQAGPPIEANPKGPPPMKGSVEGFKVPDPPKEEKGKKKKGKEKG